MLIGKITPLVLLAALPMLVAPPALAQPAKEAPPKDAAAKADYSALKPDPTHIPFTLADDIKWEGAAGRQQTLKIYGDPNLPGPYSILMKWWPGAFSRPHIHEKTRYITVISGNWWVSSSAHYDPDKTYPIPAGSVVRDEANTVHWDGAKGAPVILQISGEGPAPSLAVDEQGKRLPPRPPAGPGAAPGAF